VTRLKRRKAVTLPQQEIQTGASDLEVQLAGWQHHLAVRSDGGVCTNEQFSVTHEADDKRRGQPFTSCFAAVPL
jgi:hypothetical protein